ncbi:hypothetical protein EV183_000462 [Coemansia sp. RSA 2336]|nr:hypothetical protein EV183_000462 [Coemansia sp. RSA 2336]
MRHLSALFSSYKKHDDTKHHRRVTKDHKLTAEALEWLPEYTLTANSIEDIRRCHANRLYLVNSRPAAPETDADEDTELCFTTSDDKPACVVCLEEYLVGQHVRVVLCGHVFHDECITQWLVLSKSKFHECPICKTPCFPDEVVRKAEKDASRRSSRNEPNLVSVF